MNEKARALLEKQMERLSTLSENNHIMLDDLVALTNAMVAIAVVLSNYSVCSFGASSDAITEV